MKDNRKSGEAFLARPGELGQGVDWQVVSD